MTTAPSLKSSRATSTSRPETFPFSSNTRYALNTFDVRFHLQPRLTGLFHRAFVLDGCDVAGIAERRRAHAASRRSPPPTALNTPSLWQPDLSRCDAGKALSVAHVARAFVMRNLRIRAQRTLEGNAFNWIAVHVFRSDDFCRRHTTVHPALERLERFVIRVSLRLRHRLRRAERNRSRTTAAVIEPGHEEGAVETLRAIESLLHRDDGVEVIDAVLRRNQRVGGAVVVDQLMAQRAELFQVGAGGVGDRPELFVRALHVLVEVEHRVRPVGLVIEGVAPEGVGADARLPGLIDDRVGGPAHLAAGIEARIEMLAGARVR